MAVDRSVVPWFRGAAQQLLAAVDSPEEALAMALAKVTGHSVLQARRILGFITISLTPKGKRTSACVEVTI